MAATYNWAYKPGVTNKYNLVISASADNVRPANCCYVALFGNDLTGNGSRQYPFRTITKGCLIAGTIIVASGVYRESAAGNCILYGDGDVIMDGTTFFTAALINGGGNSAQIINIKFRNWVLGPANFPFTLTDCRVENCKINGFATGVNNVFSNLIAGSLIINAFGAGGSGLFNGTKNNTFVNCLDLTVDFANVGVGFQNYFAINNIFYNCNIKFKQANYIDYSVFYNCNVLFSASASTTPTVFYPSVPSGYTQVNAISDLRTAHNTGFPSPPLNFPNSIVSDPLFNNKTVGDFSLAFGSPAKNLSYFGTSVGACSIGYGLLVRASEAAGAFDFSTNVNLTIADDSITIIDTTQIASIQTKVISNLIGREISKLPTFGFNADRNGQYIDSILDLSVTSIASTGALTLLTPYLVQIAAITYAGNTYQPGDRFTTDGSTTAFTTASGGVCYEILEAPQRHTVMARFSDGTGNVAAGSPLVIGYWYLVINANIVYDSVTYTPGSLFKAIDTNTFTGSGILTIAMSTETFQHYEIGIKPYSNNTGNTRVGSIIRGNGDPAYVRGGINVTEFPINAKFIQLKYILQIANLTP